MADQGWRNQGWRDDERRRWDHRFDEQHGGDTRYGGSRYEDPRGDFRDQNSGRDTDYGDSGEFNRRPGGMRDTQDRRSSGRSGSWTDLSGADDRNGAGGYGGDFGFGPADYQDYGDWQGQGSFGAFGGPRFGDNFGRARDAYGRGYRNYGTGNYGSANTGNYGTDDERRGFTDYGPDYADSRQTNRSFWNRASDEVASWVGDDDAARRRDRDRHQGHSGRGPKGYVRSDDRIHEDVNDRLTDDWLLDATNIEVTVRNGEVTLTGIVDSRDDKHRAEHLVETLSGVKHVQNNLRVDSRPATATTNPAVSTPVGSSGQGTTVTGTHSGTSTGSGAGNNLSSTH